MTYSPTPIITPPAREEDVALSFMGLYDYSTENRKAVSRIACLSETALERMEDGDNAGAARLLGEASAEMYGLSCWILAHMP